MPVNLNESDTLQSLRDILDKQRFDVILVDYNLSGSTGIDALELVQCHPVNADAATIMITGYDQSEIAVKALKMGCQDYLTKEQLSPERLRGSVMSAIQRTHKSSSNDMQPATGIEDLAHALMAEYSASLQPEIAQVVRELQTLRTMIGTVNKTKLASKVNSTEQRCIRIWSALGAPTVSRSKLQ